MRFNVIKELFLTNLLYSFSPQRIKYRKKFSEKTSSKLWYKVNRIFGI